MKLRLILTLIVVLLLFALPVLAQAADTDLPDTAAEFLSRWAVWAIVVAGFCSNRLTEWIKQSWTFLKEDETNKNRTKAAKILTDFTAAVISFGFGWLATEALPLAEWLDTAKIWPIIVTVWPVAWGFFQIDSVRKKLPFLNAQKAT